MLSDPTQSVEAQIGEHMASFLADEVLLQEVRYIDETERSTLKQVPFGTAVRTYLPEYEMEECDRIRVSIVANSMTQLRVFRDMFREDYFIDTIVHQRLMDSDLEPRGELPSSTVESRQDQWRAMVTERGDEITKIADQIAKAFERKSCCTGARVSVTESEENSCAVWLNYQRGEFYSRGDVGTQHVIYCGIRHHWVLHRRLMGTLSA